MQSIRELYSNEYRDKIIIYFMKTILNLQTSGIEKLPVENNFLEPIRTYLELAVELIIDAQPKEMSELILTSEYDFLVKNEELAKEDIFNLQLIKEISLHIHYDDDYYGYILMLVNIWGNLVSEYAVKTFYPNLPKEVKKKYSYIEELMKHVPKEMICFDNY